MTYPWTKMNLVPLADLEFWHHYVPSECGSNVIPDYSGHNRTISCGAGNSPVLTGNVINGEPGWYFNGSRDPLSWSGTVQVKHLFMIASVDEATFSDYRGLVSGLTTGDLLTGNSGTNKFFDYSEVDYRKSDVQYASNAAVAPISNNIALIEIRFSGAVPLDGYQIGKHRAFATRLHKGYFIEGLAYSADKNDFDRLRIYRYAAMRYHLWQKTAAGLDVYPFPSNKSRSSDLDQEEYLSEPYSGDPVALVRGGFKRAYSLPFSTRIQPEFEAAEAYVQTHRRPVHSVLRDYRFYPARDSEGWITSSLREQGSEVTYRFNYSFEFAEIG